MPGLCNVDQVNIRYIIDFPGSELAHPNHGKQYILRSAYAAKGDLDGSIKCTVNKVTDIRRYFRLYACRIIMGHIESCYSDYLLPVLMPERIYCRSFIAAAGSSSTESIRTHPLIPCAAGKIFAGNRTKEVCILLNHAADTF